jgi:hypothetical protein
MPLPYSVKLGNFILECRGPPGICMARRGGYMAAVHPPDVKAALGAIGRQLRARSMTVTKVALIFSEAGYGVGEETLRRWTKAVVQPSLSRLPTSKQATTRRWMTSSAVLQLGGFCCRNKKWTAENSAALPPRPLVRIAANQLLQDIWQSLSSHGR